MSDQSPPQVRRESTRNIQPSTRLKDPNNIAKIPGSLIDQFRTSEARRLARKALEIGYLPSGTNAKPTGEICLIAEATPELGHSHQDDADGATHSSKKRRASSLESASDDEQPPAKKLNGLSRTTSLITPHHSAEGLLENDDSLHSDKPETILNDANNSADESVSDAERKRKRSLRDTVKEKYCSPKAVVGSRSLVSSEDELVAGAVFLPSIPKTTIVLISEDDSEEDARPKKKNKPKTKKKPVISSDDSSGEDTPPKKQKAHKRSKAVQPDPDPINADGFLADISVTPLTESASSRTEKTLDIVEFFSSVYSRPNISGVSKNFRDCRLCPGRAMFTSEVTTLRRHLQYKHAKAYRKWAKKNKFESRLPEDITARKVEIAKENQTVLDAHLRERPVHERVIPYSDVAFRDAAIEWLIATDQPLQALEHPKFQEMISMAARATNGVHVPGRKSTRAEIMKLFKDQLTALKTKLNSSAVSGEINLTCDAWQAGNVDGYFAVTGHWIEETSPAVWELQEALLGYTHLNSSHNGTRLGQALFKIVERVGIAHKVGYMTCDNAKNNGTMLVEFARQIKKATGNIWNSTERRINCLAHIINLGTQVLIKTHSKSPHYDPHKPKNHIPKKTTGMRDAVGLVRSICVKERSSAKRKELFKQIQLRQKDLPITPLQLILDMKIRWSSTYYMLFRAFSLRKHIQILVYEMGLQEKDLRKREKIDALQLTSAEWDRIDTFLGLLAHSEKAQQAFSSDLRSTLHLAIPALEAISKAWTSRAKQEKYTLFAPALREAAAKIDEYHDKTKKSDAYIIAMLLDPRKKTAHIKQYWDTDRQTAAMATAERVFKARYLRLHTASESGIAVSVAKLATHGIKALLRELTPEEDEEVYASPHADPSRPWLEEFHEYLDTREGVPEQFSTVDWWGPNATRYPTWGSLARDHLSIMASSVSSERAFSSGGITITKRRNRLKGDVVEALQCLKCLIRRDLLFRETLSFEPEDEDSGVDQDGWDCFLEDEEDCESGSDSDEDVY